jgi:uncharacterized membrane protein YdbT with pleckstrin-like domain
MVKDPIEKLAKEKAEESAKKEAWKAYFAGSLPFFVIACIMALIGIPTVIYTIIVLIIPFAGWILYSSVKSGAYKAYYEKYLKEFRLLREHDR